MQKSSKNRVFKELIEWIAYNDEPTFDQLGDIECMATVTMLSHVFNVDSVEIARNIMDLRSIRDLRKVSKRKQKKRTKKDFDTAIKNFKAEYPGSIVEVEQHLDSEEVWIWLHKFKNHDIHIIHEFTYTEAIKLLATVEPCDCDECNGR